MLEIFGALLVIVGILFGPLVLIWLIELIYCRTFQSLHGYGSYIDATAQSEEVVGYVIYEKRGKLQ